ncbi:hypothetical protein B0H65DRAFT_24902 [Neurospora tetraspora]|uniref:Uncharacterized protein n=1 Tax=Neurospora tetraspora TaxID=94610 RepID=A0AAE0JNF0_9PEZI|nr:hypothetical protein B0H65DRAFT_24902 [Neurospora tetraspora]
MSCLLCVLILFKPPHLAQPSTDLQYDRRTTVEGHGLISPCFPSIWEALGYERIYTGRCVVSALFLVFGCLLWLWLWLWLCVCVSVCWCAVVLVVMLGWCAVPCRVMLGDWWLVNRVSLSLSVGVCVSVFSNILQVSFLKIL